MTYVVMPLKGKQTFEVCFTYLTDLSTVLLLKYLAVISHPEKSQEPTVQSES